MSFILDALRRAETQRGNQPRTPPPDSALGDIAEKPSSLPSPRWIAMSLVAALAIAVLAVNVFSPRDNPATPASDNYRVEAQDRSTPFPAIAPDTPLAEVVTPATREVRPLGREARGTTAPSPQPTRVTPGTVSVSNEPLSKTDTPVRTLTNLPEDPANSERLPSYAEVALSGRGQMPEFHLDIHVYAPVPADRFVFVNNRKYREGQQLDEGGTVERITPVGVVLNHRGRRFELVPD